MQDQKIKKIYKKAGKIPVEEVDEYLNRKLLNVFKYTFECSGVLPPLQLKKPQMVIKSQKAQKPEAKDGDLTPIKPKTLFDTPENEDDFESEQKPNNNGIFNSSFDADLNVEKIGALDINEQEIKFENEISDLGDNVELPDEEDISQMVNELTLNEKTEATLVKGIQNGQGPVDPNNPEKSMVFLKNYLIQNLKQLYKYDKTQIQKGIQFQVP